MLYLSTGGRPRARRMLTDRDSTQQHLFDLFGLRTYAPPAWVIHATIAKTAHHQRERSR